MRGDEERTGQQALNNSAEVAASRPDRRAFLSSAAALGSSALASTSALAVQDTAKPSASETVAVSPTVKSIIGHYGQWGAGLSGGGLQTVFLGGMDDRSRCAICVGFMSTWKDFLMSKSFTHTWMAYAPLLPKYLDFPEILGLRAPLPTLVQSCTEDDLYTLPEMRRADDQLREVFAKCNAAERYIADAFILEGTSSMWPCSATRLVGSING